MRVVVIGATGHIGTWLVPRLVKMGHDVVAVSRGARSPYHRTGETDRAQRVLVDRTATERDGTFGNRVASLEAEVVIDLICFDTESARQLVDALRGRVRHLVHCGTLWVHGIPASRPYDEAARREPFGDYGIKKAAIEKFLLDASRQGFPATVLHPGHITGPGWAPVNPVGNLDLRVFQRLAHGESLLLPDDGLATLQHVHADDVAQAFALAVENRESATGEAFHVAALEPVSMRDYAIDAASWFGREAKLEFAPWNEWRKQVSARDAELTHDHALHSPAASVEKIRRVLGFEPRYTALTAAREAIDFQIESGQLDI